MFIVTRSRFRINISQLITIAKSLNKSINCATDDGGRVRKIAYPLQSHVLMLCFFIWYKCIETTKCHTQFIDFYTHARLRERERERQAKRNILFGFARGGGDEAALRRGEVVVASKLNRARGNVAVYCALRSDDWIWINVYMWMCDVQRSATQNKHPKQDVHTYVGNIVLAMWVWVWVKIQIEYCHPHTQHKSGECTTHTHTLLLSSFSSPQSSLQFHHTAHFTIMPRNLRNSRFACIFSALCLCIRNLFNLYRIFPWMKVAKSRDEIARRLYIHVALASERYEF